MTTDQGKSICACGHIGDGPNSSHTDTFQAGHGRCRVVGCGCVRFTWVRWKKAKDKDKA